MSILTCVNIWGGWPYQKKIDQLCYLVSRAIFHAIHLLPHLKGMPHFFSFRFDSTLQCMKDKSQFLCATSWIGKIWYFQQAFFQVVLDVSGHISQLACITCLYFHVGTWLCAKANFSNCMLQVIQVKQIYSTSQRVVKYDTNSGKIFFILHYNRICHKIWLEYIFHKFPHVFIQFLLKF